MSCINQESKAAAAKATAEAAAAAETAKQAALEALPVFRCVDPSRFQIVIDRDTHYKTKGNELVRIRICMCACVTCACFYVCMNK